MTPPFYSPYRPKQSWSLPNRYILSIIGLLIIMAVSLALAIMFPYVDDNDGTDSSQTQDVEESSVDTGSGGNHRPNLFDNDSSQNSVNDALSSTGTQSTAAERSSCQSLLLLADADSNGMMNTTEYRNFIDELKVSDYLAASSTMADSMADFDFGAYSSVLDGLPTSLKLKFLSLSSSSSEYCLSNETATTTVICIGVRKDNTGELDHMCEETIQVMEDIVGGRM